MIGLSHADTRKAGSAAMSGKLTDLQALAAIVLWNSGLFDTLEIATALTVGEDAVCRTLHAARSIGREG
ncbi:hypothetical protein [Rhizobium straminoryzae]|uniref:Uncharacterized protein n=1 Tax=Rhizobium straminoryzae TaxID=1387186 RepID=A0A549T0W6_9HYPH|nr:hypothetical protein [Rhizobium straminoryzae]TRL35511.1 hypothetical protein FNA46_20140 [Rhizobium straminoryzae]